MSTDTQSPAAVEKELWRELDDSRCGMLGAGAEAPGHFVPMSAFPEAETHKVWFYTHRDSELAKAGQGGAPAALVVMSKDQDLQACVRGRLRATLDPAHRDKYWSPVVAAWFPQGKDDPDLTMLCMDCADADVWISKAGLVKFGWELAKANLTGSIPDIGAHLRLSFA